MAACTDTASASLVHCTYAAAGSALCARLDCMQEVERSTVQNVLVQCCAGRPSTVNVCMTIGETH